MSTADLVAEVVHQVLADHPRVMAHSGDGYTCGCGAHFPDADTWHRHRADLAAHEVLAALATTNHT